jgi:hypothetical protein
MWKHFPVQCSRTSLRTLLCSKDPGLRPLVLMVRVVLRWRWVWSTDGMILRGKHRTTCTKTCFSATLYTTNPTWTGPRSEQRPHHDTNVQVLFYSKLPDIWKSTALWKVPRLRLFVLVKSTYRWRLCSIMERNWQGKTQVLWEKYVPIPLQISYELTWDLFLISVCTLPVRLVLTALAFTFLSLLCNTHIHTPGKIRTRNPSKRSAADPRLRPLGHWDRLDRTRASAVRNRRLTGRAMAGLSSVWSFHLQFLLHSKHVVTKIKTKRLMLLRDTIVVYSQRRKIL